MIYDDNDDQWYSGIDGALAFLTFVIQLRKNPRKTLTTKTDPSGDWTWTCYVRGNDVTPRPQQWCFNDVENRLIIIIMSVLPKGRSFTASAGTQAAALPKAGFPPQTQEPGLQFYQGFNRCGSFPLLSALHSLFSIWTDLKRFEKIPGAPSSRWGEWIWLTGPCGLHRNSPQRLIISVPSGFLSRSEILKSQLPFAPYHLYWNYCI